MGSRWSDFSRIKFDTFKTIDKRVLGIEDKWQHSWLYTIKEAKNGKPETGKREDYFLPYEIA